MRDIIGEIKRNNKRVFFLGNDKAEKDFIQYQPDCFIPDELLCEPLLFYDCPGDICEPELLTKYRELTGEYPKKMIENEKFQYTRYLYKLYYNILKHNNMQMRIDMINQMLKDYPVKSVAIRMGGVTSSVFYYNLSEERYGDLLTLIKNAYAVSCICL